MEIMLTRFARIAGGFSVFFLLVFLITGCGGKGAPTLPESSDQNVNLGQLNSQDLNSGLTPAQSGLSLNPPVGHPLYYPGEVLVVLNGGIVPGAANLQGWPLKLVEEIVCRWGTVYELAITDGTSVPDMVARLQADPSVRFAEPNYIYYFDEAPYFPNDPMWAYTDDPYDPIDSPYDQWGPTMIGASVVWNETKGSESVTVAIMDTGVRKDHEDLVDNIWLNEDEIAGNGIDDDSNGYIDDTWGWDCWDDDNDPYDDGAYASYHGSACSGVAAAVQDNFRGLSGIAPDISIMAIKVDLTGYGNLASTVVEGMNYASVNHADIVSMSFGTTQYSDIMETACDDAWNDGHGVILMASAGNDSTTGLKYPTAYESVMTIGATVPWSEYLDPIDEKRITYGEDGYYWGSNYGEHLNVMGYGAQYTTTYGGHYDSYWDGGYNGFFGGTSCACPMTAGVMALIRSYFPANSPSWSWDRLEDTADDLYTPGFDIQSGYGRVNALRAVYGSDRYADQEDIHGFVTLNLPHEQVFDTIHDVPGNPYLDTQDLYRFTTAEDGNLLIRLDIFTWGENLELALYSDLNMTQLVDSSTGANHYNSSYEEIFITVDAGTEYFLKVFSPESGSSTTYGLLVHNAANNLAVTGTSIAPEFIHHGKDLVPFLKLDLVIGWQATLDRISVFKSGTLPNANFVNAYLYRDTNLSGAFEQQWDQQTAEEVPPGTNRAIFPALDIEWDYEHPLTLFVVADISEILTDCTVAMSLESYKDIVTSEGISAHYSQFPIYSESVLIGTDTTDPTWPTTTGAQTADPSYHSVIIGWNEAEDSQSPPAMYNIYYTDTLPFDIGTATKVADVNAQPGTITDLKYKVGNLPEVIEQHFVVRAEDQAGNEEDNLVIVSAIPSGGGDPENPEIIETIPCDDVYSLAFNDSLLLAGCGYYGMRIYDRSDPANPQLEGNYTSTYVYSVSCDNSYAYCTSDSRFSVVNLADPSNPITTDYVTISNGIQSMAQRDGWAYVVDWYSQMTPIEVTDPADIIKYGSYYISGDYPYSMVMSDSYIYIGFYYGDSGHGVAAVDWTNHDIPSYAGSFGADLEVGLWLEGDTLYSVNADTDNLSIYDISTDPEDPPLLGQATGGPGTTSWAVTVRDGYAYVVRYYSGIVVFDVTVPSNPVYAGSLSLAGLNAITNDGEIIYAADDYNIYVII